jgi:predicted transposase YdaD
VKSDPHFHTLCQGYPEWYFHLTGHPVPKGITCASKSVKALQRTIDNVLTSEEGLMVMEFQLQKDATIYLRTVQELVQLMLENPSQKKVHGVIIFGTRRLDHRDHRWASIIQVHYLDEEIERLRLESPHHPLVCALLPLFERNERRLEKEARHAYTQLQNHPGPASQKKALLDIFTDFLLQRYPNNSFQNLAMLMKLTPLHKTRAFKENYALGREEGREEGMGMGVLQISLLQAEKRFGKLSARTRSALEALDYHRLEALALALLDMKTTRDLTQWLKKHK